MKKFLKNWKGIAINYLISDDLISFYTFFTVIFAECAYLWAFQPSSVAIRLTIVLLAYIANVIVFAWLKGWYEGNREEPIIARLYVVNFIFIFVIGCFINFWINLVLTAIAFGVTFLWINIRTFQDTQLMGWRGIVGAISKLFNNVVFWLISQIVVLGLPFAAFTWMLALIPGLPLWIKIVIPIIYFVIAPFIALLEDEMVAQNIFEIAYDIWYDNKFESEMKKYTDKYMLDCLKNIKR